ncbi:hypothetical protein E2C01_097883 [Portunus trituberculatus]|uniref:Uncharacterized protein n=1 Tax=Portunus trituberculatus TaxID=210409 RepID=A0A5B7K6X1_PORTR|nr:hypothetical protein [Portunus trituberculatus]
MPSMTERFRVSRHSSLNMVLLPHATPTWSAHPTTPTTTAAAAAVATTTSTTVPAHAAAAGREAPWAGRLTARRHGGGAAWQAADTRTLTLTLESPQASSGEVSSFSSHSVIK